MSENVENKETAFSYCSMKRSLIVSAYHEGRNRGTSLSLGYYASPDYKTIFCKNPNSPEGFSVGQYPGFSSLPIGFRHFDMSDALAMVKD